jgi:hypothetical protein
MQTINQFIVFAATILNRLIPLIISLTLLYFLFGIFKMVLAGGEQAKKEGKQIIAFGVIALAVMISVWGLVNLLRATTGLQGASTAPQGPGVPRFK